MRKKNCSRVHTSQGKITISGSAKRFVSFFLVADAVYVIAALAVLIMSRNGMADFHTAVRFAPAVIDAAAVSLPITVCGGIVIDLTDRGR